MSPVEVTEKMFSPQPQTFLDLTNTDKPEIFADLPENL